MVDSTAHISTPKRMKLELRTSMPSPAVTATTGAASPNQMSVPPRSYTPPPNRDPRIKTPYIPTVPLPTLPSTSNLPEPPFDDMGKL